MLFYFKNDINNILEYNDLRSYKYILYISYFYKLNLYL